MTETRTEQLEKEIKGFGLKDGRGLWTYVDTLKAELKGRKEATEEILKIIEFMEKAYLTYDVVSLNDKEIKEIIDKIKKIGGIKCN